MSDARPFNVFISYSRKDSEKTDKMVESLEAEGFDVTIDRSDLPYGEEWQAELAHFIRASDTVVWLVSSHSIISRWCLWELGEVQRESKRLIPVVIESVPYKDLPEMLGRLHLLPAEGIFDEQKHLPKLIETLNTDYGWLKHHTRLAEQARVWRTGDRNRDQLLRGSELVKTERWCDRQPRGGPPPTDDILELILASRQAQNRRQRITVAGAIAVAAVSLALSGLALTQRNEAARQADIALANEQRALDQQHIAEAQTVVAQRERKIADDQRSIAEHERDQALIRQSRFLSLSSQKHLSEAQDDLALLLALEALPDLTLNYNRPYVADAGLALIAALGAREVGGDAILSRYTTTNVFSLGARQNVCDRNDLVPGARAFVQLDPDGMRPAEIIEISSGRVLATTFDSHSINDCAFSADRRYLAIVSYTGLDLFDSNRAEIIYKYREIDGLNNPRMVGDFVFDAESKYLSILTENFISTIDISSLSIIKTEFESGSGDFQKSRIYTLTNEGRYVSGFNDYIGKYFVLDNETGDYIAEFRGEGIIKQWTTPSTLVISNLYDYEGSLQPKGHSIRITDKYGDSRSLISLAAGGPVLSASHDLHWTILEREHVVQSDQHEARVTQYGPTTIALYNSGTGDTGRGEVPRIISESGAMAIVNTAPTNRLITINQDGYIRVWDDDTGSLIRKIVDKSRFSGFVTGSPDGEYFVAGSGDADIGLYESDLQREFSVTPHAYIYRAETGELIHRFSQDTGRITAAMFSANGRVLAIGGSSGRVDLFNLASLSPLARPLLHDHPVQSIWVSQTGNEVRIELDNGEIFVWRDDEQREVFDVALEPAVLPSKSIDYRVSFAPRSAVVSVVRNTDDAVVSELRGHEAFVRYAQLNRTHNRLITRDGLNAVRLWDVPSGVLIGKLGRRGLAGNPTCSAFGFFSPDGTLAVTTCEEIDIWDTRTGKRVHNLVGHSQLVTSVAIDLSGRWVVSASGVSGRRGEEDFGVRLWDLSTGQHPGIVYQSNGPIEQVGFSPNGQAITILLHSGERVTLPIAANIDQLVQRSKRLVARCLDQETRHEFFLDDQPPLWCVTGPGNERDINTDVWRPLAPYNSSEWVRWGLRQQETLFR